MSDNNHNDKKISTLQIIIRIILVIILVVPVETLFFVLGIRLIGTIYFYSTGSFPRSVTSGISIQRFFEFWLFGLGIYILHIALYIFFLLVTKVKIRYDLLGALIIAIIVSRILWITPSSGGGILDFSSWWWEISNYFLFAMITFAVFTLSTVLLDKHITMAESGKILISFVLSLPVGYGVSWLVWLILFRIFHG